MTDGNIREVERVKKRLFASEKVNCVYKTDRTSILNRVTRSGSTSSTRKSEARRVFLDRYLDRKRPAVSVPRFWDATNCKNIEDILISCETFRGGGYRRWLATPRAVFLAGMNLS